MTCSTDFTLTHARAHTHGPAGTCDRLTELNSSTALSVSSSWKQADQAGGWQAGRQVCRAQTRPRKYASITKQSEAALTRGGKLRGSRFVSSVVETTGRNDLIFKGQTSEEETVLADCSSSGENRCCGDETRDKHRLITNARGN